MVSDCSAGSSPQLQSLVTGTAAWIAIREFLRNWAAGKLPAFDQLMLDAFKHIAPDGSPPASMQTAIATDPDYQKGAIAAQTLYAAILSSAPNLVVSTSSSSPPCTTMNWPMYAQAANAYAAAQSTPGAQAAMIADMQKGNFPNLNSDAVASDAAYAGTAAFPGAVQAIAASYGPALTAALPTPWYVWAIGAVVVAGVGVGGYALYRSREAKANPTKCSHGETPIDQVLDVQDVYDVLDNLGLSAPDFWRYASGGYPLPMSRRQIDAVIARHGANIDDLPTVDAFAPAAGSDW